MKTKLLLLVGALIGVLSQVSCTYEHNSRGYVAPFTSTAQSVCRSNGYAYAWRSGGHQQWGGYGGQVVRQQYPCGSPSCVPSRASSFQGPTMTGRCGCRGRAVYNGSNWSYQRISSCGRSGCRYHAGAPAYIRRNPPQRSFAQHTSGRLGYQPAPVWQNIQPTF